MSLFTVKESGENIVITMPTGNRPDVVLNVNEWKSLKEFIDKRLVDDSDCSEMIVLDDGGEMIEMKYGDHPLRLRTFTFIGDEWFGVIPKFELTREQAQELSEIISAF